MKTLTDQLAQYAAYHRDPRNIQTHFVGVPMIVAAVTVLLSRPSFEVAGLALSPATFAVAAAAGFYLLLDIGLGCVMAVLLALALWLGAWSATLQTAAWLGLGIGGFVVGWLIQFVGHYYEGRKPAFVDDIVGLLIGPLFVVAEALFLAGMLKPLQAAIEARCGPVRIRQADERSTAS